MLDIVDHPDSAVSISSVRYLPRMPETMPLPEALTRLQQSKSHLAIVAAPDGSVSGMVTLEDLVEDLIGTVRDGIQRG